MKYARVINNTAYDVRSESPDGFFTPEIASQFIEVPDEVKDLSFFDGIKWNDYIEPEQPIVTLLIPVISPVEFKLLFTPQERLAIKSARATDEILDDLFTILDDPRLKEVNLNLESNKAVMAYLEGKGLITTERKAEIMTGIMK